MTAIEWLNFVYPASVTADPTQVTTALTLAADYRPSCLPEARQDEAQALYAAYLLEDVAARSSGGYVGGYAGPIVREKEGQLERQYADTTGNTNFNTRDTTYYGRWKELNDLCGFGAIVTRFG